MKHSQSLCLRRSLLTSAFAAGLCAPVVQALEIDTGSPDWSMRFDNTIKYNYGVRTESADKRMLGTPNNNDGDYNFRTVSYTHLTLPTICSV